MRRRAFGETGLDCSEIGLGTWALGSGVYGEVERTEAHNLIGQALDTGINFFDTAPLYGNKYEDGVAEIVLGEGLGRRKDQAIISTKFGRTARQVMPPRFNADEAKKSCDDSLKRLGRDWIDLFFFHSPFESDEIEDDVWQGLTELKQNGKIRFIGHSVSIYDDTKDLAEEWMSERKIDAVQSVLSPV
ncbi:MAG: aldo/keto reductase, partial [Opitutales bacterium]|nr:aldo/keto reductase [Opitutales bacterium]